MQTLDIRFENFPQGKLYRLRGRLDRPSSIEFQKVLETNIAMTTLINLEGVDYLNSSGLGLLVNLAKKCKDDGKKLALCCVQSQPKELICVGGFQKQLIWYDAESSAKESLGFGNKENQL